MILEMFIIVNPKGIPSIQSLSKTRDAAWNKIHAKNKARIAYKMKQGFVCAPANLSIPSLKVEWLGQEEGI